MKLQGEFWKAFQGFAIDRTEKCLDRFERRAEYARHVREVDRLGLQLVGERGKDAWEIWDRIATEQANAEGIVFDVIYLQGLRDGFALSRMLSCSDEKGLAVEKQQHDQV